MAFLVLFCSVLYTFYDDSKTTVKVASRARNEASALDEPEETYTTTHDDLHMLWDMLDTLLHVIK